MTTQQTLWDIPEDKPRHKKIRNNQSGPDVDEFRSTLPDRIDWADEVDPILNPVSEIIPDAKPHPSTKKSARSNEPDRLVHYSDESYRESRVEILAKRFANREPFYDSRDGGRLPLVDLMSALISASLFWDVRGVYKISDNKYRVQIWSREKQDHVHGGYFDTLEDAIVAWRKLMGMEESIFCSKNDAYTEHEMACSIFDE